MALVLDQQSNFWQHFCKICKKGFGCGRALGGHMRAHGIGEESVQMDGEDGSDCDDVPSNNKRMYGLRSNPNRLKSCRVCRNCGKEFLSWKSFLEHGKYCASDDMVESPVVSSPDHEADEYELGQRAGFGWSKRKRSVRTDVGTVTSNYIPSSEEEDLANCLMMLSKAHQNSNPILSDQEESCCSASKEENLRNNVDFISPTSIRVPIEIKAKLNSRGLFECKACKKVFNSHQALGGHRASHKKIKGCFAARLDQYRDDNTVNETFFPKILTSSQLEHGSISQLGSASKQKARVHECSICHRIFSSGQALGGHKRCHWITSNAPDTSPIGTMSDRLHDPDQREEINRWSKLDASEPLDLNLPAPLSTEERREIIYLQSWTSAEDQKDELCGQTENDNKNDNMNKKSKDKLDDEGDDNQVSLAKLCELKDMNVEGTSSPWLQVGIGPTPNEGADP